MNRNKQMWGLMLTTAITLIPVYWLLGWQSGGHSPDALPAAYWYTEAAAWSARALVEAWALVYLFQTEPRTPRQDKTLTFFEITLIILIGFTVGLVIIANGTGQTIGQQNNSLFWIWSFAVAAFAPLMLGSVGYCYRIGQPARRAAKQKNNPTPTHRKKTKPVGAHARKEIVATMYPRGATEKEMAAAVGVTPRTIRRYVSKLNGNNVK